MSVDEIISSLDEHALKSRESLTALRLLKFKLKNDKEKALEAIKLNLIDYCEKLIEVITTDDEVKVSFSFSPICSYLLVFY